jgi:hypothetical protein
MRVFYYVDVKYFVESNAIGNFRTEYYQLLN